MSEDRYPIRIDEATGRARVTIAGEISARKILNTFAAIVMNRRWSEGDRTVLWDAKAARFPASFEFKDIFKATQVSKALTRPGKSAIVVEKSSAMLKKVARFYQGIALTSTNREVEMFFDVNAATSWLDQ
jgi:hypothetical protein